MLELKLFKSYARVMLRLQDQASVIHHPGQAGRCGVVLALGGELDDILMLDLKVTYTSLSMFSWPEPSLTI